MALIKNRLIGAVKAGQAALGWDDETYRSVVARLAGGKTSATKCTLAELEAIKEYMHEQGFPRIASKHGRRPRVAAKRKAMLSKIGALLTDAGRPWQYAEAMAGHMYGQLVIEWLTDEQLNGILVALVKDQRRRSGGQNA